MSTSDKTILTPRIGISACLLGRPVRYDGGHKLDAYLRDVLGKFVEWVPVCPEAECGLGVPREAMRLVGDIDSPRRVTRATGIDHTDRLKAWAETRLEELAKEPLDGFVLKARSPSCGMRVEVFDKSGKPCGLAPGLFARALPARFPLLLVVEDEDLRDEARRGEFLRRVRAQKTEK
jgi:uncharacterized protein YbbK (DUF523 family)